MRLLKPALLALAFLAAGCPRNTGGQTNVANAQARAELDTARQRAASGDPQAQAELERLQQQYRGTDVAGEALYSDAELAYGRKDYAAARGKYRDLLTQFPLFPQADTAKYHLGLSALALGDFRDALQTLTPLYDHLSPAQKPEAADALSRAAVGARAWGDAVRFLAEAEQNLTDPEAKKKIDAQLFTLVDGAVPQLEIAKLAQTLSPSSPAYALVQFKLARIAFHLRNWDQLEQTLTALQQNAPGNPFSADAQKLLERAHKRDQVKPGAIGVILPLSGKYQRFGEAVLAGIKLAFDGQGGIELIVKDSAGDTDKAKQAVQSLVLDDQVMALIGPVLSAPAAAAVVEADELGVPIITLSHEEGITSKGPYVFRNMLTNSAQSQALVDYATRVRGFKTFAVLYPNVPYGVELANAFWDDVLAAGGVVNGAESYDHDQTTFSEVVKKLVGRYYLEDRSDYLSGRRDINASTKDPYKARKAFEKLRKELTPVIDFEALFIPDQQKNVGLIAPALAVEDVVTNGCDARDMERIAKTMGLRSGRDVKSILLLGANGWDSPDLIERGGKFVQCSVFVDGFFAGSARPATEKFVKAFQEANAGHAPDLLSAYGYDSAALVLSVLTTAHPATRDAFRDALAHVKGFPGATGSITIDSSNEAVRPLFLLTIDRNGIRELTSKEGGGS